MLSTAFIGNLPLTPSALLPAYSLSRSMTRVLKRARAVSNWDIAGKRQLNSTSDTNRYYIMRNRGFLARYMQIYGDYHPMLFRLGNAATFCKEFIRLAAVDKCFKTGIPALRRGMKDARKIIKDPNWKPMPPMKDTE